MLGPTDLITGTFVAVDIEATGGRPGTSDIIEIGAARIQGGRITDTFETLVRPREPVPPVVAELTGITDGMLETSPDVSEAIRSFATFAEGAVLVAHNHRFDLGFLDYEAERWVGHPFQRPVLDTLSLARRLLTGMTHYNLRVLAATCGATAVPNHRALPDALATAEVFISMIPMLAERGVLNAEQAAVLCGLARHGTLSRKLSLATHLPDGPGLYLFRDESGDVVYVGRAKDLRARVRSHFYSPADAERAAYAAHTACIDHISCTSRLDALLLESRLLDHYRPRYNRDQHRLREPLYLHIDPDVEYPAFRVTRRRLRSGVIFGPVANEWAAATLAQALSTHFRLRRCTRSLEACGTSRCPDITCCLHDHDVSDTSEDAYRRRVTDALAIFNGGGATFRESLNAHRERAVTDERYEDAIRYRDAARALDRTLSALGVAARAAEVPVRVVIEGDERALALHVLVHGWLHTTVRAGRDDVASGTALTTLARALHRARRRAGRPLPITARRLRDMLLVDGYLHEHRPVVVSVDDDVADAVRRIDAIIRRVTRAPRKRHATPSDA